MSRASGARLTTGRGWCSTNPWRRALAASSLLVAGAASAAPEPIPGNAAPADAGLRFEDIFTEVGEPAALHYRADFMARGKQHTLEVWRDGGRRLVRRTGDAIETHVTRQPGDPDYQMIVLDLRRKIETRVSREDLYRLGNFTDWFDLAHGLRHPKAAYRLTAIQIPAGASRPLEACRWYALEQSGKTTHVCWSARQHLPMQILADHGQVLWQVTLVEQTPGPAAVFQVRDFGFVQNDAHRDISGD